MTKSAHPFSKVPADTAAALQRLEKDIMALPLSQSDWIDEVCRHTLAGGKRIRPLILLLTGAALRADMEHCLQLAGTVEFIHNATLLHDDVIDNAPTRHNRPSVNQRWGKKHGILAGDMLYARAFALIAATDQMEIRQQLAETAAALAESEFLQLLQKQQHNLDEALYFRIVKGKTASLFRFCCLAPAILSNADTQTRHSLASFGESFGMIFQLTDDALDCAGDLESMGKMPGTDLRDGNLTLTLARALQQASPAGKHLITAALEQDSPPPSCVQEALAAVHATDAVEYTLAQAGQCADTALAALGVLGDGPHSKALTDLVQQVLARTS